MKKSKLLALVLSLCVIGAMMIVGVSAADVEVGTAADLATALAAATDGQTVKVVADIVVEDGNAPFVITADDVTVEGVVLGDGTYPTITYNTVNVYNYNNENAPAAFGVALGNGLTLKNINFVWLQNA